MANVAAMSHSKNAAENAALVRGLTERQAELAIAQAIHQLAIAVQEIARKQE